MSEQHAEQMISALIDGLKSGMGDLKGLPAPSANGRGAASPPVDTGSIAIAIVNLANALATISQRFADLTTALVRSLDAQSEREPVVPQVTISTPAPIVNVEAVAPAPEPRRLSVVRIQHDDGTVSTLTEMPLEG